MKVIKYTLDEGQKLGLGIDLDNTSGWPFGGPWVGADDASKEVHYKIYNLKSGEKLNEKVEFIQQPYVSAVGHKVDISEVKFPISSNKNLQKLALDQVRFKRNYRFKHLLHTMKTEKKLI